MAEWLLSMPFRLRSAKENACFANENETTECAVKSWIALLRGINVGGNNKLPMAELRMLLDDVGLVEVQTYIQSGNIGFKSDVKDATSLETLIAETIAKSFGFEIAVFVLEAEKLIAVLDQSPFSVSTVDGNLLHFYFLKVPVKTDVSNALDDMRADSESWHLTDDVFYLFAPDGIGRSKLASKVEKTLGVPTTTRNFRTVQKLIKMSE